MTAARSFALASLKRLITNSGIKSVLDNPNQSIQRDIRFGFVVLAFLVGVLGSWAVFAELSGAVVAQGILVVDSNIKKVQHPNGGIVDTILVRDGMRVRGDDILIRLDSTLTRANLAILVKNHDELLAGQSRLEAERDGTNDIEFSSRLLERKNDSEVARIVEGEKRLFELRKEARNGQKSQLNERILQFEQEIGGLSGQALAKKREIELILVELEIVRGLHKLNHIPISRLTALEREAVRLEGERNQLVAAVAQTNGKIAEIKLQIIQIDQDLRSEVARELREIQAKLAEVVERLEAAADQMRRIDIRAPQSGTVHQLSVHTKGAVIAAGELLMYLVPDSDELTVEVRGAPRDIDQVFLGQEAKVRIGAFNQRTTPELNGIVNRISADINQDQTTGQSFYLVRIGLPASEVLKLKELRLVPGMPIEAFIRTDDRTVLSFLVKPLQEQISRAFRER